MTVQCAHIKRYIHQLNISLIQKEFQQHRLEKTYEIIQDIVPRIDDGFYSQIMQDNGDTLEKNMKKYIVPFFVWADYDIEEQDNVMTSLNYLSNYVYEAAGISFPAFNQFLDDVHDVMPVINAFGYYSQKNKKFVPYDDAIGLEAEWLNKYEILQYNGLIDEENRISIFDIKD